MYRVSGRHSNFFAGAPGYSEKRRQISTRMRTRHLGNRFRWAFAHDTSARPSPSRAEVDDPVRRLYDLEIVFDHDDGITLLHEPVEHFQQDPDVLEVEAGRRLVENV